MGYIDETGLAEFTTKIKTYLQDHLVIQPSGYSITVNISNGSYSGDVTIDKNGTAQVVLSANYGYSLPQSIIGLNTQYTYDSSTGIINLSNPAGNVIIEAECDEIFYSVTTNVTNGTYFGASTISALGTEGILVTPNEYHTLPSSISVTGATYTYNDTTGMITIYNATENVVIDVVCEFHVDTEGDYIKFSSPDSFTLNVNNNTKSWDGTLETSTDKTNWTTWSGTTAVSSASDGTKHNLYVRGIGNTYITGSGGSSQYAWRLNGSNIAVEGNIETLLDYSTVSQGNHPAAATGAYRVLFAYPTSTPNGNITDVSKLILVCLNVPAYCFYYMFQSNTGITNPPQFISLTYASGGYNFLGVFLYCTGLVNAPKLPKFETVPQYCCQYMFYGCSNLVQIPQIETGNNIRINTYGFANMFTNCSKIKISQTKTGIYQNNYRFPISQVSGGDSSYSYGMFNGTGGTFTGSPLSNTMYYTSNAVVNRDGTITPATE